MEVSTRMVIEKQLRRELGPCEETEILLDWLRDTWETGDLLEKRFGTERARALITAPAFVSEREVILI
jgi:hypothetical protein